MSKSKILITRKIKPGEHERAGKMNCVLVECALMESELVPWPKENELIDLLADAGAIIFTSQYAAAAFLEGPDGSKPASPYPFPLAITSIPFYAVGPGTTGVLKQLGLDPVMAEEFTGAALAEKIISDGVSGRVVHFCGNRRRQELREKLENAGIKVTEVVVYETQPAEHPVWPDAAIDAVAFFSPGAVNRYFELGFDKRFDERFLAIGTTTEAAIKSKGYEASVAESPDMEGILKKL